MKKSNTSKLSGTQELLPEQQSIFDNLKTKIAETYKKHGFLNIETPSLERTEILLAKAGGETEKQIYKVHKTAETVDDSTEALRFDHTIPLARYIVEYENALTFPFKAAQIGLNFRGERAQKGRFREFYQCDIDIIGREKLDLAYDADVISTLLDAFAAFNLKTPVLARISNRKILSGFLEFFNLTEKSKDIYSIVDHAEKISPEKTEVNLSEIGLNRETAEKLLTFINLHGDRASVIEKLNSFNIENPTFKAGVAELDEILHLLEAASLGEKIIADLKIVRGLDYYTGTVFEFILPEYKHIGSVCGGGRYENLAEYFSEKSFPGVGGSIGLTRLFYVLNENNLLTPDPETENLLDYAVIPVSSAEFDAAFRLADELRRKNFRVTVVLTDKKLGDKISYAAKLARKGIVLGEEEVKTKIFKIKNFITGEEEMYE